MYSTDHYLVNEGTVTPDDLLITINGSLSMTLNATLHNNTNLSKVMGNPFSVIQNIVILYANVTTM